MFFTAKSSDYLIFHVRDSARLNLSANATLEVHTGHNSTVCSFTYSSSCLFSPFPNRLAENVRFYLKSNERIVLSITQDNFSDAVDNAITILSASEGNNLADNADTFSSSIAVPLLPSRTSEVQVKLLGGEDTIR